MLQASREQRGKPCNVQNAAMIRQVRNENRGAHKRLFVIYGRAAGPECGPDRFLKKIWDKDD